MTKDVEDGVAGREAKRKTTVKVNGCRGTGCEDGWSDRGGYWGQAEMDDPLWQPLKGGAKRKRTQLTSSDCNFLEKKRLKLISSLIFYVFIITHTESKVCQGLSKDVFFKLCKTALNYLFFMLPLNSHQLHFCILLAVIIHPCICLSLSGSWGHWSLPQLP